MRLPDHWATDLRSAPAYGERNTNFRAIPTVSLGPGADFREESVAHLISTELGGWPAPAKSTARVGSIKRFIGLFGPQVVRSLRGPDCRGTRTRPWSRRARQAGRASRVPVQESERQRRPGRAVATGGGARVGRRALNEPGLLGVLACVLDRHVPAVAMACRDPNDGRACAADDQWRNRDSERTERRSFETKRFVGHRFAAQ